MKNKKGQHEILGFVLIVLIVSIIGVIFLSLMLTKSKDNRQTSLELSNLLIASMYYTTDCTVSWIPYYEDVQELIKKVYKDENLKCLDGRDVLQALNSTLKEIIEDSLRVGEDSPNKAYKLNIYYNPLNDIENKNEIIFMEKGIFKNCSAMLGGSHLIRAGTFSSETINVELDICSG